MVYAKHCRCSGFYKKETRRECKVRRKEKSVRGPEKILQIEGWINENIKKIREAEQSIKNDREKLQGIRQRGQSQIIKILFYDCIPKNKGRVFWYGYCVSGVKRD